MSDLTIATLPTVGKASYSEARSLSTNVPTLARSRTSAGITVAIRNFQMYVYYYNYYYYYSLLASRLTEYSRRVWRGTGGYTMAPSLTPARHTVGNSKYNIFQYSSKERSIDVAHRFCRKTTLTRHIQKCHQGEVVAEEVEFKWDDEASESDPDAESDDELAEQAEPEASVELVSAAPDVKMVLRPRNYNYRRDYWPLPCETSQEAHPVVYPHTPTEVMQGQMGQAHLEQQAMINHQIQMDRQAQIDRQAQLDHQSQVDMQARLDHQAQVDHQARVDHQAQIDHQARIEQQQAQMDQHFNQMEYLPMQPVHNDSYYQSPQMVQQPPQTMISSYLNAMTLNEQPPCYDQTQFYFDDNKLLDFQLPSERMSGEHYWQ